MESAYLKSVKRPPIHNLAEKIAHLAESEEEAIAEVGGQGGEVRDFDHLDPIWIRRSSRRGDPNTNREWERDWV